MGKTKVALGTNILISDLGWEGNPNKILNKIINKEIELVISNSQFDELSRVLDYPKFEFTKEQKNRLKRLILEIATFVKPTEKIAAIKEDPDDNLILECAVAGDVGYIITGDPDLLNLNDFRKIKVKTAREFLEET